ncbi:P-loop containing nucleoside triphosphate hydrolase protein [Xylaria digitata]|nr:P-loop containing nucleoside triphosphate hydrolase protein [Xylaria digitata]
MDSVPASGVFDDNRYSNRQDNAFSGEYKAQGISNPHLTNDTTINSSGVPPAKSPQENGPTQTNPNGKLGIVGSKRKSRRSEPANETRPKKRQNTSLKKLSARKAELENQFENLSDWTSKRQDLNAGASEYTPEQLKREETEHSEAKLVLGSKYKSEGHEPGCHNELGRIEGMSTSIRDYQTKGVAFMVRNERSRNDCRGGIVADDMGIGKTVQSIACILANPPSKKAVREQKSVTLIIVPNQGLIKQWTEELMRHAKISKKEVCKYAGGKTGVLGMVSYPVVLATYSQVEKDFRLFKNKKEDDEGPLFEIEFFRIILDEGDNIKNYNGNTSKACAELKASLKWVLSGTPLRNSVQECLPYFRFLGINVNEELESFKERWGAPKSDNVYERTMQILAKRMIRREAGQIYLGREMCSLPKSSYEDRLLDITEEEKAVSRHLEWAMLRVEAEARETTKRDPRKVDPNTPKSNFRVQTTRLRQAVDHPFLLESCIGDFMNQDEVENLITDLEKIEPSKPKVKRETTDESTCSQPEGPSIYKMVLDIKEHLRELFRSRKHKGCFICSSLVELQSLECSHAMCRACYEKYIRDTIEDKKSNCMCPQCGKIFGGMPNLKEELDDECLSREELMKPRSEVIQTTSGRGVSFLPASELNKRSPGDDSNGVQPRTSDWSCRWLKNCDEKGLITTSTKTKVAIEIVNKWQKEASNDKIVIFTEWIVTAKVLGRMLNRFGIKFVYYNGQISVKHRDENLKDFKGNADIKVMVASMAAGNVGLNITEANRMIIMNPWWNHAAEAQAFGRIRRHGQKKETHLVCLFAKESIDERIYTLQNKKRAEINSAMNEGKKPKPLSQEERYWLMTNRHAPESPLDDSDGTLEDADSDDGDESA